MNILTHQCELFEMKNDVSIKDMHTQFTNIIDGLKSIGKTYQMLI